MLKNNAKNHIQCQISRFFSADCVKKIRSFFSFPISVSQKKTGNFVVKFSLKQFFKCSLFLGGQVQNKDDYLH
jgi:hypothetical protein